MLNNNIKKIFVNTEAVAHEIVSTVISDSLMMRETMEFMNRGHLAIYYGEWENKVIVQIIDTLINEGNPLIDEFDTWHELPEDLNEESYSSLVHEVKTFLESVKELNERYEPFIL